MALAHAIAFILVLVVLVHVVAAALIFAVHTLVMRQTFGLPTVDVRDAGAFKTGDLLLVSYRGPRRFFATSVYASPWNHAGIVWRSPTGEPFVLEAAAYRKPYIAGIVRVPLLWWSRTNRNMLLAHVPINRPVDAAALDAAFQRYQNTDITIGGLHPRWTRFLRTRPRPTANPAGSECIFANDACLTCHEIVVSVLQDIGVLDATLSPSSFLPRALAAPDERIGTRNGFAYGAMRELDVRGMNRGALL